MSFAICKANFILMVEAYNFLASWQLFPEKGTYESGQRPKSGIYRIESTGNKNEISISQNFISMENEGSAAQYKFIADNKIHPIQDIPFADEIKAYFPDGISFEIHFLKTGNTILEVSHEIMPNGFLKIITSGHTEEGNPYTNTEVFHKQMSVLPYSASVSGAVIKPNEEGIIRHKALLAMEEQTNMQLMQIRKQIELLALQAQEIHKRKELSTIIYNARLNFRPDMGQTYYLYEKQNGEHTISLISPDEWGKSMPYKAFITAVKLLADSTWMEL